MNGGQTTRLQMRSRLGSKLIGKQGQLLSEVTARARALGNSWDPAKHA
jgi:hypothetical protein